MGKKNAFPCHAEEVKRLNRVCGQIEGIKKMVEERRYCPDILTQMRAARSALKSIEANILERHLNHCVTDTMKSGSAKDKKQKIDEIKEIFRRFEN